jgi:DNA-directed RNA polymerase subunit RPC12/RpoP
VVVAGSAAWLIFWNASTPGAGETVPFLRPAACSKCGAAYAATFGDPPAKCEKCGGRTLWQAVKCLNPDCHAIVPVVQGDSQKSADMLQCPKCGASRFGEVRPDDLPTK